MSIPSHEDRCIGCLLGVACGDILGAGIEGWRASEIREIYGQLRNDTQMTLALVVSLLEQGRVEAGAVSTKYAEFYEPWRGYGGGAQVVMHALTRWGQRTGRQAARGVVPHRTHGFLGRKLKCLPHGFTSDIPDCAINSPRRFRQA